MNIIPSVNLQDFLSGDEKRKQKFVDEIGKAYEEIGFVALNGHFLEDKLVDDLYSEVKKFFNLPLEVKQKYEIPGIGGQRSTSRQGIPGRHLGQGRLGPELFRSPRLRGHARRRGMAGRRGHQADPARVL